MKTQTAFGEDLVSDISLNAFVLVRFTKLTSALSGEPWDSLKVLYAERSFQAKAIATIINGCVSSRKKEFLLSRNLVADYLRQDPNIKSRKGKHNLSGEDYKKTLARMLASVNSIQLLDCLYSATTTPDHKKNLAGIYRLVHPQVLGALPKDLELLSAPDSIFEEHRIASSKRKAV